MAEEPSVFSFGDFELDEGRRELRRAGSPVDLQLKPFQLLVHLVRNRDRAVPKEELFERIWADAVVSDAALSTALRAVRQALGDDRSCRARPCARRSSRRLAPPADSGRSWRCSSPPWRGPDGATEAALGSDLPRRRGQERLAGVGDAGPQME